LNQFNKNYPPLRKFVLGSEQLPQQPFEDDYDSDFGNPNIDMPVKKKKEEQKDVGIHLSEKQHNCPVVDDNDKDGYFIVPQGTNTKRKSTVPSSQTAKTRKVKSEHSSQNRILTKPCIPLDVPFEKTTRAYECFY